MTLKFRKFAYFTFLITWPFYLCRYDHGRILLSRWSLCNRNVNNNNNNKFIQRTGTRVSNALRFPLQYCANRDVFNWRLKLSTESSGSCRYSGKLFQMVCPAAANERGPYVDNLTAGTISWLLCDDRSWYLDVLSINYASYAVRSVVLATAGLLVH